MSARPNLRRADKAMTQDDLETLLAEAYCGRLATVGDDGYPYCVPLLYVWEPGRILLHNSRAKGHLRRNVAHSAKACFEIDEPGAVFDYGRFECDSTLAYRSAIAFGEIAIVEDETEKAAFFDAFMAKYRKAGPERPKGFYPRLKDVTVYALKIETVTGKVSPWFEEAEQWPAKDNTKSPKAVSPASGRVSA